MKDLGGISRKYEVDSGVYAGEEILAAMRAEGTDPATITAGQVLELAKKHNFAVAYYAGGIGHGIRGNNSELQQNIGVAGKRVGLPEEGIKPERLHEKIFASTGQSILLPEKTSIYWWWQNRAVSYLEPIIY